MYLPFISFVNGSLISFRTNWRHLTISCTIRASSSCRCCMQFDALTTSIFCWILTLLRPSKYIHTPLVGLHEMLHFSKKIRFALVLPVNADQGEWPGKIPCSLTGPWFIAWLRIPYWATSLLSFVLSTASYLLKLDCCLLDTEWMVSLYIVQAVHTYAIIQFMLTSYMMKKLVCCWVASNALLDRWNSRSGI